MDFTYLAAQTFGDDQLEDELLALFLAQSRRIIPSLSTLAAGAQDDAAHLLKGSAHAIGADDVAAAAAAWQACDPAARGPGSLPHRDLVATFAATEASIETHRASRRAPGFREAPPRP